MNSELEKLIEKYRITVNGLADLESGYEKVIKERGFVTLNGLLVESNEPAGEGTENTVNTENTPVAESDASHSEPTPVVEGPVSGDTNLGNEVAGGERAAGTEEDSASTDEHNPSGEEETSEEEDPASTEDSTTGGKPKKKKK